MTYREFRFRGFSPWRAFVGAFWWKTGFGLWLHVRHLDAMEQANGRND